MTRPPSTAPDRLFTRAFVAVFAAALVFFVSGGIVLPIAPRFAVGPIGADAIGFGIAIVATLFWPGITTQGYILIAVAALIGSAIGVTSMRPRSSAATCCSRAIALSSRRAGASTSSTRRASSRSSTSRPRRACAAPDSRTC